MIYATAGHVDHGKTSLVKAITHVDTDRLAEEKARGLTIDLGFAYWEEKDTRIGFIDVPGHARFISNMLAGVSTIDHALIVIAADDGPMPQTVEHVAILQILGVTEATIALTKIDRVSEQHLEDSKVAIQNLLTDTPFASAKIFPTSTEDNRGIEALKKHLLSQHRQRGDDVHSNFRLAIDRKFSIKGAGVVVTGSVFSGKIELEDELYLMPQGKKLRLRGLHRQDSEAHAASVGDRCALNISGDVEQEDISRSNWITSQSDLPVSNKLDGQLTLLQFETSALRTGAPVHFHLGAQHTTGRVFLLDNRHLNPAEKALVQISLAEPISACVGDRFVIRNQSASRTLGGGQILDPFSVNRGRSRPGRLAYLNFLTSESNRTDLDGILLQTEVGLDLSQYQRGLNRQLAIDGYDRDKTGLHHHPELIDKSKQLILQAIKTEGQTLSQLRKVVGTSAALVELTVAQLAHDKKVAHEGSLYRLPDSKPALSKPAESLWARVEPILSEQPLQPPVISELAKKIGLPPAAIDKLLGECIKHGLVVRPVQNRYFKSSAMEDLRKLAVSISESNGGQFTVIQFRDASGLGRNLCIELLEHLDAKGFTKRLGDQRIIQDTNR
jgi:selenocysteine-specific elongation factor